MKIQLATVPWQALDYPSLAIGILTNLATHSGHSVTSHYGNLRFGEFLLQDKSLGVSDYLMVAESGFYLGLGDWSFAAALNGVDSWHLGEYASLVRDPDLESKLPLLQTAASRFVEQFAEELVADSSRMLCLTSTFSENAAALAVAKRVKKLDPRRLIALGGGNCDGVQGEALHRNYPFLDFVVRGEGEHAFPDLLEAIESEQGFGHISGLSWRKGSERVDNPARLEATPVNELVTPSYDAYFSHLEASALREHVDPRLVMETSRGCWWGEKHHCTFCGLNGTLMLFRSRPESRVLDELEYLVSKHQVLDVIVVDNIIDMGYFTEVLPKISALGWDLRMHYEVKSNLKPEQLDQLADAGVVNVQPGIENLSTPVLKLMRKGVTGALNVRFLRAAEESGCDVSWNYLYGFPGETEQHYESVIEQVPNLYHLSAPDGPARIAIERFSPYFNDPSLGFETKRPAASYRLIFDLPESELRDIAFLYDSNYAGISGDIEQRLSDALETWRQSYRDSFLTFHDFQTAGIIRDGRAGREPTEHLLDDYEVALYRSLNNPQRLANLRRDAEAQRNLSRLNIALEGFVAYGLVFVDDETIIALATSPIPTRVKL